MKGNLRKEMGFGRKVVRKEEAGRIAPVVLALVLSVACTDLFGQVLYVDADASGSNDGSSWANAYGYLQDALAAAGKGDVIRVAEGIHRPDLGGGATLGDRYCTFALSSGVVIRGGYAGVGQADPNFRDIRAHETILSGDLAGDDGAGFANSSENGYHVVTGSGADDTAVLDGCTITAGCADADDPDSEYAGGGGMYCKSGSPTVLNCVFTGNRGRLAGGLHVRDGSSPRIVNCVISGNEATLFSAGGMASYYAGPTLINCTLANNVAPYTGSAMDNYYCSPVLINCIVWANTVKWTSNGLKSQISGGSPIVSFSCVQDADPNDEAVYPGPGNTDDDPKFVDLDGPDNVRATADDNLRLLPGSPCLDAGNNAGIPPSAQTDLDGQQRIEQGAVDMGAYEGPDQGFLLSTESIIVPEGQTRSFTVALAMDPCGPVIVTAAVVSGDPDISVSSGQVVSFDSNDYGLARTVTVTAAEDEDYFNGTATVLLSGPGLFSAAVTVTEWDDEALTVLYVDQNAPGSADGSSWADAFTDLQEALAVARAVAQVTEVRVAAGVYRPAGPGADRAVSFELIDGVSILGGYAGFGADDPNARDMNLHETTLSGDLNADDVIPEDPCGLAGEPTRAENSWHVVRAVGNTGQTAVLDGFTITAGNAGGAYSPSENDGGGMNVFYYSNPTIRGCTFRFNSAAGYGGGLRGMATLVDCAFVANAAMLGGGMDGAGTLLDCTFRDNLALLHGGGLNGPAGLTRCTFIANRAVQRGGAVYYSGDSIERVLSHCRFLGNAASAGGGMYCNESDPLIANCIFSGNTAIENGGAIFTCEDRYSVRLINCTLSANSAGESGGALYVGSGSDPLVTNCILWCNAAGRGSQIAMVSGSAGLFVSYSDVEGGSEAIHRNTQPSDLLAWNRGNIDIDPLLQDPCGPDTIYGTGDDDLRLSMGSACIDAGLVPQEPSVPGSTDVEGNPRMVHGAIDIGACEYQGPFNLYVDAVDGNDLNSGLSPAAAFATIQKGIDSAENGLTVLVSPGVYTEELNFQGKAITVTAAAQAPVLEAPDDYAVSFYGNEQSDSVLSNFVIRGSYLGVFIVDSAPTLRNLTVVENGFGIAAYTHIEPDISDCIFWNNADGDLFGCQARYSCIQKGTVAPSNISSDPLLADPANGDYHLLSRRGRYVPSLDLWVLDAESSPCIDAGDPTLEPVGEPMPNGGRLNMGAHGGTAFASMSEWLLASDMNRDGLVDFADLALFCEQWLAKLEWAE